MRMLIIRHWLDRKAEKILTWFVWRLPKKIVMWSFVRVTAHASTGKWSNQIVPDLTAMDALKRWNDQ